MIAGQALPSTPRRWASTWRRRGGRNRWGPTRRSRATSLCPAREESFGAREQGGEESEPQLVGTEHIRWAAREGEGVARAKEPGCRHRATRVEVLKELDPPRREFAEEGRRHRRRGAPPAARQAPGEDTALKAFWQDLTELGRGDPIRRSPIGERRSYRFRRRPRTTRC